MAGPNQQNAHNSSPAKPYQRRGIDSPVKPVAKSHQARPAKRSRETDDSYLLLRRRAMQHSDDAKRRQLGPQVLCLCYQKFDPRKFLYHKASRSTIISKLKIDPHRITVTAGRAARPAIAAGLTEEATQASDEIRTSPMKRLSLHDGTPPVSPKRQHQASDEIRTSPMKRLSLHDGVPSVPGIGKCYRCGREGHWMAECASPAVSPCFQCGKPGHWKKDCPEFR
uniref:CCHC-type domain-containing protein n=1 Tax=Ananas comosus var. bracteatus TaxID=296719 RepID=A0A6V7NPA8_ANACO|nr:unnamed protein product [Ananas comosus var. bracteatus]